ncbi:hypothetical protein KIL84_008657 [Mauremys mutica]|uniref:Uncharacterized protein n=1 Tax=Mauremys mutica TaxID=74926 RepID=A0A9D3X7I1_9SAUR|nr:hypothetical protein KIL84_008657 [Mauremys mutica]
MFILGPMSPPPCSMRHIPVCSKVLCQELSLLCVSCCGGGARHQLCLQSRVWWLLAGRWPGCGKGAAPFARPELRVAEGRRRCTGLQLERRCNVWSSAPPPARCGNRIYAPP